MQDETLYVVGPALCEAWVPVGIGLPVRLLTGKQIVDEGWGVEEHQVLGGQIFGLYKKGTEAQAAAEIQGECPCSAAGAYLASCTKE